MIRILHLADLHLDTPFSGLPEKVSAVLREDLKSAFSSAVELAKNDGVKIALLAGDLFDNEYTKPSTAKFLIDIMAYAPKITFFIAPGNHDCAMTTSIYELNTFPENVHIFKKDKIECVELPELNACVYGIGAVSPHSEERVLQSFRVADSSKINIMVMHGMTSDSKGNTPYYPVTATDIENSGLDYLALGHIHGFSGIKKAGETYYAYPGCTFGRGFDELNEKGVIEGYVGKGQVHLDFLPVSKRSFIIAEADLNGVADYQGALAIIKEALAGISSGNVVRLILKGAVRSDFIINLTVLKESLDGMFYLELEDKTTVMQDVQELRQERTLKGLFTGRILDKMESEADPEQRALLDKALRYGLAALNNEEIPL